MNIKMTKNTKLANCITHAGTFHADEIFATIILSKILPEIVIARVSDVKEKKENQYIYDIGGGEFDHHQFGGNGQRKNGVKYAACGLIWKAFGKQVLEKYEIKEVNYVWDLIDRDLIQYIDANDNGQIQKIDTDYRFVHLARIIAAFNPNWDENIDSDEKFLEALKISEVIFDEMLQDTISKVRAKRFIDEAIDKSDNRIMILDKFMPWRESLLESENEKAKEIEFVIFPSNRGGFNVYTVPKDISSFQNRKDLPKEWAGLRDKELQNVTGIETARFCHNACFLCVADKKEDAIKLAILASKK